MKNAPRPQSDGGAEGKREKNKTSNRGHKKRSNWAPREERKKGEGGGTRRNVCFHYQVGRGEKGGALKLPKNWEGGVWQYEKKSQGGSKGRGRGAYSRYKPKIPIWKDVWNRGGDTCRRKRSVTLRKSQQEGKEEDSEGGKVGQVSLESTGGKGATIRGHQKKKLKNGPCLEKTWRSSGKSQGKERKKKSE